MADNASNIFITSLHSSIPVGASRTQVSKCGKQPQKLLWGLKHRQDCTFKFRDLSSQESEGDTEKEAPSMTACPGSPEETHIIASFDLNQHWLINI